MNPATAIYLRVSTVRQDTASQEADMKAFAIAEEAKGITVVYYQDKMTGKTMQRPGFQKMEADIQSGKVNRVIVWRLDRLGRTMGGLTNFLEDLQAKGVGFLSVKDGFDLSTPASRFTLNILASVAKFETEIRAERIAAGIAAKRLRGEAWNNGRPKGSNHKTTEEVRQQVKRMKEAGESIAAIARVCKLSRQTIYAVLSQGESQG